MRGLVSIVAPLLLGLPVLKDCAGDTSATERTADTDRLYAETNRLAVLYADSMRRCGDSVALQKVFRHFNDSIDVLNQSVAVDADLHLTKDENLRMNQNMMAIRNIYEKKMRKFRPELSDTFSADTIPDM